MKGAPAASRNSLTRVASSSASDVPVSDSIAGGERAVGPVRRQGRGRAPRRCCGRQAVRARRLATRDRPRRSRERPPRGRDAGSDPVLVRTPRVSTDANLPARHARQTVAVRHAGVERGPPRRHRLARRQFTRFFVGRSGRRRGVLAPSSVGRIAGSLRARRSRDTIEPERGAAGLRPHLHRPRREDAREGLPGLPTSHPQKASRRGNIKWRAPKRRVPSCIPHTSKQSVKNMARLTWKVWAKRSLGVPAEESDRKKAEERGDRV